MYLYIFLNIISLLWPRSHSLVTEYSYGCLCLPKTPMTQCLTRAAKAATNGDDAVPMTRKTACSSYCLSTDSLFGTPTGTRCLPGWHCLFSASTTYMQCTCLWHNVLHTNTNMSSKLFCIARLY